MAKIIIQVGEPAVASIMDPSLLTKIGCPRENLDYSISGKDPMSTEVQRGLRREAIERYGQFGVVNSDIELSYV